MDPQQKPTEATVVLGEIDSTKKSEHSEEEDSSSGESEPAREDVILEVTDSTKKSEQPEEEDSSSSPVTASLPDDKVSYSTLKVSSMLHYST